MQGGRVILEMLRAVSSYKELRHRAVQGQGIAASKVPAVGRAGPPIRPPNWRAVTRRIAFRLTQFGVMSQLCARLSDFRA